MLYMLTSCQATKAYTPRWRMHAEAPHDTAKATTTSFLREYYESCDAMHNLNNIAMSHSYRASGSAGAYYT